MLHWIDPTCSLLFASLAAVGLGGKSAVGVEAAFGLTRKLVAISDSPRRREGMIERS